MRQKHGILTLFLLICLLFSACGAAPSPGTQVSQVPPSPSIFPPTFGPFQVVILQNGRYVPAQLSRPGFYLPKITVTGNCTGFGPSPNFLPALLNTFSIPAGQVLVVETVDPNEIPTTNGVGVSLKGFITMVGPNSYDVSEQRHDRVYAIVPTAQVGRTIAFMVISDFTADCTPKNPSILYDCSLVDLGKLYPYPARFSVKDLGCPIKNQSLHPHSGINCFQWPSETTSTTPSTTCIAV